MDEMRIWTQPVTMKDIEPPCLQHMGDYVYRSEASGVELIRCSNVGEKLYLPDRISHQWITALGSGVLRNCNELTGAVLPRSLRSIGDYAFYQCEKLEEVRIADGVRSIGDHAFALCKNLKTLYVPPTVESIGEDAFEGIEDLTLSGAEDSAVHRYAREKGVPFVAAGGHSAA